MKKLAGLLAVPLLVACGAGPGSPAQSVAANPSTRVAEPSRSADLPGGADGLPDGMLDGVIALAEEQTGVDRSEIAVVLAEAVTWSDGSIGCPEDGMMYTQALVPGYRVVLEVGGEELAFHAPENGDFSPCAEPVEPVDAGNADR